MSAAAPTGDSTPAGAGWATDDDPSGFSISHPRDWTVRRDAASGWIMASGPRGESAVIWPVYVEAVLQSASAAAVLQQVVRSRWPEWQWTAPRPLGGAAVVSQGRAGEADAVAALAWVVGREVSAGRLYVVSAPRTRYAEAQETMARILASFRARGPEHAGPARDAPPALRYVAWEDPQERAFHLEVPQGWTISGGLTRAASVDTRTAVAAVSPDGRTRVAIGDAQLPPFVEPNQMLQMAGLGEGSWYSPGYGVNVMVRRYETGIDFVQDYVANGNGSGIADFAWTERRERDDAVQAINNVYREFGGMGMEVSLTAGEAKFTARVNGRPICGSYFAGTQATRGADASFWNVQYLFGYVAPPEGEAQAQEALSHMLRTFEPNPEWVSMQQNIAANTSQIVHRTNEEISEMILGAHEARQGVSDEIDRRRSNAMLEVEDAVDPATGRELRVESGSNYYWIDYRGNIVGTQTDTRPDLDFRQLVRRP